MGQSGLVINRYGSSSYEGELFILCLVVVYCGRMLYTVNGYMYTYTAMDYTMVVSIHHIGLY